MLPLKHLFAYTLIFFVTAAALGQSIIYVDVSATGANNGLSWRDAFTDLHDALAAAGEAGGEGIQMWIAAGEYMPGPADEDPQSSFQLVSGVAMYGGFAGWETRLDERDWQQNETILRRDVPAPTVMTAAPILVGENLAQGSALEGLAVRDGYSWSPDGPGGLMLTGSHFAIVNCTFASNRTSDETGGGGIYALEGILTLENCAFVDNLAILDDGGAISAHASELFVNNCTFDANDAGAGGAIAAIDSKVLLHNSVFLQNKSTIGQAAAMRATGVVQVNGCMAEQNGGDGYILSGGGTWSIARSTFTNNAGAVDVTGDLVIEDSTFISNVTEFGGPGGIRVFQGGSAHISGCLLEANYGAVGGAILTASPATILNTVVSGNSSNQSPAGVFASDNLVIIDSEISDNTSTFPFDTAGGVGIENGNLIMLNTLVTGNWPQGVRVGLNATAEIINSTIAHNALFNFSEDTGVWIHPTSTAEIHNSILWGNGPAGGTCANSCGSSGIGCWCDENCCDFGDCCGDKFDVCGGCEPEPYSNEEILSHQIKGAGQCESFHHSRTHPRKHL